MKNNYKLLHTISCAVLFTLFMLNTTPGNSQLASGITHSFAVSTTSLIPFPAPATNIIVNASVVDEWDTLVSPAGWSFSFAGATYTKIVISTNGWMALIPDTITSLPQVFLNSALPFNNLSYNTTGYPILAPLWDDLSSGLFSYVVDSNSLWVRWAVKWQKSNPQTNASLFYAKLDGTNNTITYYYSNNSAYVSTTPSASIGIAGACPGDFYSVNCTSHNSAFTDSLTENTTIGVDTGASFRPYNCAFTFTPYNLYDECSGNAPAKFLGTVNSNCLWLMASTIDANSSGNPVCSTLDTRDVWFSFFKPAGIADVYIKTSPAFCGSVHGTSIEVYDSCGGNLRGCSTTSLSDTGFAELTVSSAAAETLYVRVTADGDVPGKFQLCVQDLLTASAKSLQNEAGTTLVVYPNPASDKINLTIKDSGKNLFTLTFFDVTGRMIYSGNFETVPGINTRETDVSQFPKGLYILRLENNNNSISRKFLIK